MDNLTTVFWILMTISAVSVLAFIGFLATWVAELVKINRPARQQRHESIPVYYGRLMSAH